MAKELVISTGRHETRVAIMEEDQLVEIYFQRANEYSLAGSIHKGRVTRVLPGMQSAFVDLGLERDTFLYVSDFFEENEEFEKMPEGRERNERAVAANPDRDRSGDRGRGRDGGRGRGRDRERREPLVAQGVPIEVPQLEAAIAPQVEVSTVSVDKTQSQEEADQRRGNRRRRRGRPGQGGNFPDSKFAGVSEDEAVTEEIEAVIEASHDEDAPSLPILLPGESLSKYSSRESVPVAEPVEELADLDVEEETAELLDVEEPAAEFKSKEQTHAGNLTPLKAITKESIAERREAEVLEEVKEHLAEIAKEKEELRDFEEAERLAYQDKEAAEAGEIVEAASALEAEELESEETDEKLDLDEAESAEFEVLASDATSVNDPDQTLELGGDTLTADGEATDGVLPSHGYSAHLRQTDQRFLQQRPPQDGGTDAQDRSGRRRRRGGRGRDRERTVEVATAPTEAPVVESTSAAPTEEARDTAPRRDDGRREGRSRRDRGGESGSDRGGDRGERTERAAGDRQERPDRDRRPQPSITELLKEGQEILVQIAKEPLGQKGARITSHIALPGRYCVYMPTVDHTGVSRKIASDEERLRLKRILQSRKEGIPGGFIIRTAGEGRTEEEILADIDFLHNLWIDIRKKAESKPAPALIYHDLEIVERVMRDQLGPEFKSIWVDNEEIYESILRFLERFQPAMVSRVKMYTRQVSIFDNFGITQELEKALRPKVWLKSGGYIVINQTEALVAIDINTGKFVGKSNRLEDTIVKTNIEAIREIVRQVRLRDLGGIIVIDFIDMDERKNRVRVMQALEEAMRADRAPYKILQFNDFGLVAITRKRVKQSLERTLCAPCPYCEGSAYVKSVQTVVGEILNEAKKLARALEDSKDAMLRVSPEVAKVFKSSDNQYLEELEEIIGRPVMVVSDGLIHQEKFDLA